MKKFFLFIFILLTAKNLHADDIRSFKIDGIRIGDSLYDHFSVSDIRNSPNYDHLPSDMSYRISDFEAVSKMSKNYDGYQFYYEPGDQNLIIYGMRGIKFCNDTLSCSVEYEKIKSNLISLYGENNGIENTFAHPDDPNSLGKLITFDFAGGSINASFIKWSSGSTYVDNISIDIYSAEVSYWVQNGYTF